MLMLGKSVISFSIKNKSVPMKPRRLHVGGLWRPKRNGAPASCAQHGVTGEAAARGHKVRVDFLSAPSLPRVFRHLLKLRPVLLRREADIVLEQAPE